MSDFLFIEDSLIAGKGVFARKSLKKFQTICFLNGEEMSLKEMIRKVDEGKENGADPLEVEDDIYLDLEEFARTFNHSCNPNAFVRGKNELVAIRKIKTGEEITYDYSTTMNDNKEIIEENGGKLWTCECNCGSKNCRKIIDQFKTLPIKTQKYYLKNKFAPDFILRKFSSLLHKQ